jgi:hypothetical protein
MDLSYHNTNAPVDTTAVANALYKELFGITPVEGNKDQASFGHLMGGYDAGNRAYSAMRDRGVLIDCKLPAGAVAERGIKYSCMAARGHP